MAKADSPDGPWTKLPEPILRTTPDGRWEPDPDRPGRRRAVEKGTVQYTEDGVNFHVRASLEDIPPAGGAYIPDKFDDPEDGQGFSWGLAHYGRSDWNFLVRFDCEMMQGQEKQLDWRHFPHYSAIRDVMRAPSRFGVPAEALLGRKRWRNG